MKASPVVSLLVGLVVPLGCGGTPHKSSGTTGGGSGTTGGGGPVVLATGSYLDPGAPSGVFDGGVIFETNSGLTEGNVLVMVGGSLDFASPPDPAYPDAGGEALATIELQVPTGVSLVGSYGSMAATVCGGMVLQTPLPAACGDLNILEAVSSCQIGSPGTPQGSWTLDIASAVDAGPEFNGVLPFLVHGSFNAKLACGGAGDTCFQEYCVPTATLSVTF
jgi:hypothetical protein